MKKNTGRKRTVVETNKRGQRTEKERQGHARTGQKRLYNHA